MAAYILLPWFSFDFELPEIASDWTVIASIRLCEK